MAKIGSFGRLITFQTSDRRILTISDMQREVGGRWIKHGAIGNKQPTEFVGPEADRVTMTVVLSAAHGVRPRKTMERIENAIKRGQVEYLVINGKKVGQGKYYISRMSEAWDYIYRRGELMQATLSLTLEEYV